MHARRLIVATLLGVSGACHEGPGFGPPRTTLIPETTSLDFGRVFFGNAVTRSLRMTASGGGVRYSARFEGEARGFAAGPARETIRPGRALDFVVRFAPESSGARRARVVFETDATQNATVRVTLTAAGVAPPDCEDGNGCTIDSFDLASGRCRHEAAPLPCDDFNACTRNDTCVRGICLGEAIVCDDQDACTDDACAPGVGCVFVPTRTCDDGNPCTRDICLPGGRCENEALPLGTPCGDAIACVETSLCVSGTCRTYDTSADGTPCDDGDPCSLNDQCVSGRCLDPGYVPPSPGELKFAAPVGPLAERSATNPIVDRNGTVYVGIEGGVAAVDQCGRPAWTNVELGTPTFEAAVSIPGILTIPVQSTIFDVDPSTGEPFRALDLGSTFDPVVTASTATVTVRVLDMAVRASGALIVSLERVVDDGTPRRDGLLAEVDRTHAIATPFAALDHHVALRVAVDADESVVAVLSDRALPDPTGALRLVRFGIDGLPDGTWASSSVDGLHADLALGRDGTVWWSAGLTSVSRTGSLQTWIPAPIDPTRIEAGAPIAALDRIYVVVRHDIATPLAVGAPGDTFSLLALTASTGETLFDTPLPARAVRMAPAADAQGNVFVLLEDGKLLGFDVTGRRIFELQLPFQGRAASASSIAITPEGVVIAVGHETIFGMQSVAGFDARAAWPRHRRDNLSTGHR